MLYIIYRDGVIPQDIQRLLAHAGLPSQDGEIITNLDLLGGRSMKALKDKRPIPAPLFPGKTAPTAANEEYALSRFEPALKLLLEELKRGTLDPNTFPYTKPPLDNTEAAMYNNSQASLRSAKPTWAQNRRSMHESKQRVIVFMAGGATYSESRACYEISRTSDKDVFLATSHMLTPAMFLRQVGDLSVDKRRLDLPSERPKPRAPAHIFEREEKRVTTGLPSGPAARPGVAKPTATPAPSIQRPVAGGYQPPTAGMANMTINSSGGRPSNGSTTSSSHDYSRSGMFEKKPKDGDEKKKRGFFSSKK
jgi:syntaxin-binding protein 1